jgi:hypothetical protein
MKALSIRILAGLIALGGLFYFLACSPATQNNNSSQNQNLASNQTNGNVAVKDMGPCRDYGSDPGGSHAGAIKKGIKDKMDSSLKRLLKDQDNPGGTFTIDVQKATNGTYFIAYVRGNVSGDDNLKELSNILNDFQDKQECLRMVYFLPHETTPADRLDGFRWTSCEHPMVVCPNGECCLAAETNTNTNVNSNANANANANANRGGNTNN